MKSLILGSLLSALAIAQYPPNYVDFRGVGGAKGTTGKPVISSTPKPGDSSPPGGTGPYKAKHFGDLGFVGHTIYSPVTPPKDMPVLIYSNNGGLAIGTIDKSTVLEIASYGYYVVVEGAPDAGFTGGTSGFGPAFSTATDGFDAINWVVEKAAAGKLPNVDPTKIFAGGTSMGGIQSYTTSQDKRVSGTLIISSGLLTPTLRGKLSLLTKPIGYFEGGTSDQASKNGKQDYDSLKTPATWANGQFGHGQVNTRRAKAIIAWLDWQAKGNATAGKLFTDPSNGYLKSQSYTEISAKNF